jgi:hypothetical protein
MKKPCPACKSGKTIVCSLPGCTDFWKCKDCNHSWHDPKLYDENEKYTEEASLLDKKVNEALRPIISEYVARGYNVREICHIIAMEILAMECDFILEKDYTRFKEEKNG